MCLIVIGWKAHANYSLVVFANRDEYHHRPTARAGFWGDEPELLAGRDRRAGGTWLGLTRQGRFAAITNVREPESAKGGESTERPSRGRLVRDYLLGDASAEAFATEVLAKGAGYAGFNLLVGDRESLYWVSNRAESIVRVQPGVYGVSNGGFDEAWPKVVRVKDAMKQALEDGAVSVEEGLVALASREIPADDQLPETGVDKDVERQLGSVFVRSPRYGTRSSTVIAVKADEQATFVECVFDEEGAPDGSRGYAFSLDLK